MENSNPNQPFNSNQSLICAIRGPVLLMTLGILLTIDHFGPFGFGRTWPALLIVFGLFKLFEKAGARTQ